jgi:hypothetical protein
MDEVIVPVTQYSVSVVSSSSRPNRPSTSPPVSPHERHFSTSHAARPAGESFRPYPRVCGLVDWMAL